jgi:hypothetical protein
MFLRQRLENKITLETCEEEQNYAIAKKYALRCRKFDISSLKSYDG